MRSSEPRNPPRDRFAARFDRPWRFAVPGPKASRAAGARAERVPSSLRRRPPMLPRGVSHVGK